MYYVWDGSSSVVRVAWQRHDVMLEIAAWRVVASGGDRRELVSWAFILNAAVTYPLRAPYGE